MRGVLQMMYDGFVEGTSEIVMKAFSNKELRVDVGSQVIRAPLKGKFFGTSEVIKYLQTYSKLLHTQENSQKARIITVNEETGDFIVAIEGIISHKLRTDIEPFLSQEIHEGKINLDAQFLSLKINTIQPVQLNNVFITPRQRVVLDAYQALLRGDADDFSQHFSKNCFVRASGDDVLPWTGTWTATDGGLKHYVEHFHAFWDVKRTFKGVSFKPVSSDEVEAEKRWTEVHEVVLKRYALADGSEGTTNEGRILLIVDGNAVSNEIVNWTWYVFDENLTAASLRL
eukprot:TRINITY_DN382_c0_g2_i1.p1 TRINITY_DN382_c0_g2~~TRINITY_DN382_c0_g2_i1.p1  ORF type:complete len:335 (+),score=39.37 TRINITY_DN382_c0_g2_i1:152-1006(+)